MVTLCSTYFAIGPDAKGLVFEEFNTFEAYSCRRSSRYSALSHTIVISQILSIAIPYAVVIAQSSLYTPGAHEPPTAHAYGNTMRFHYSCGLFIIHEAPCAKTTKRVYKPHTTPTQTCTRSYSYLVEFWTKISFVA